MIKLINYIFLLFYHFLYFVQSRNNKHGLFIPCTCIYIVLSRLGSLHAILFNTIYLHANMRTILILGASNHPPPPPTLCATRSCNTATAPQPSPFSQSLSRKSLRANETCERAKQRGGGGEEGSSTRNFGEVSIKYFWNGVDDDEGIFRWKLYTEVVETFPNNPYCIRALTIHQRDTLFAFIYMRGRLYLQVYSH